MLKQRVLVVLSAVLAGCVSAKEPSASAPIMVGSDRDAHGCKASAGYAWCEREKSCVRPWELAKERGFKLEGDAYSAYCSAAVRDSSK